MRKYSQPFVPPGYRVTDQGRVFSAESNWRGYGERELTQRAHSDGYLCIRANFNGRRRRFAVHRLVAARFLPPMPSPSHEVRHLDGDKTNNRASNLAWGTASENALDRGAHGTQYRGGPKWGHPETRAKILRGIRSYHEAKKCPRKPNGQFANYEAVGFEP